MKRLIIWTLMVALLFAACTSKAPDWQEQYDLGMRYLSEGNYQEAILAFSAAIEIDPNVSDHYLYRGDAYVLGARDMLGQEEPDCDQAVTYLQNAEADYRKAQELNENADITGRMEEVETLEEEVEILTAVPEVIPFYEEAGLEINAAPDTTEKTDEHAVRQAGWSTTTHTEVYFGTEEDPYQLTEIRACPVTVTVTVYPNVDLQQFDGIFSEEENDEIRSFREAHSDYKLITVVGTFNLGEHRPDYSYMNANMRGGVLDRNSGIALETADGFGSGTLDYNGETIPAFFCHSIQGRMENDILYGIFTMYLLVPQDYDGAVFYVGYSSKDHAELTTDFPLYSSMPGSDTETYFFALPEE